MTPVGRHIGDRLDHLLSRHRSPAPDRMAAALERVGAHLQSDSGAPPLHAESRTTPAAMPRWGFDGLRFIAAGAVVLLAAVFLLQSPLLRSRGAQASVEAVDGTLTRVTGNTLAPMAPADRVRFNETLRTDAGAGAQLVLNDGSRVEMRARSELALERADDGVRIRLQTGGIIVSAAKQRRGHLYVQTKDVTVSVVGTVFSVNAADDGSRVTVIEGEVHVRQGADEKRLRAGEQVSTSRELKSAPVFDEIGWSRDLGSHLSVRSKVPTANAHTTQAVVPGACGPDDQTPMMTSPFDQPNWNGWGGDPLQRRFQAEAMAGLTAANIPSLRVKWAFGFPDVSEMPGQPTVVGGRLFVASGSGKVYSLNAASGCQYWTFDADAPVRTAISVGVFGNLWIAYVADEHATVYALDALTGFLMWKRQVETFPGAIIAGAPTLAGSMLYAATASREPESSTPAYECCRFRGSVSALDAATGVVRWKTYTIADEPKPTRRAFLRAYDKQTGAQIGAVSMPDAQNIQEWGPSGASVWSSPAVDMAARRVYVTTGRSFSDPPAATAQATLALNADNGALVWSKQLFQVSDDLESSTTVSDLPNGLRAIVSGQSGTISAVDTTGRSLWRFRNTSGTLYTLPAGIAADASHVYSLAGNRGNALVALALTTGELRFVHRPDDCLDSSQCIPSSSAVTAIPGAVFAPGPVGHLHVFSSVNGSLIWETDTTRDYPTVNGVRAAGGRSGGAIVVDGMVYLSAAPAIPGGPGGVLLAFSIDGK